MPIVAHSALPTFNELRLLGEPVLSLEDARSQDIRELHIGLLNMMPDAALEVTEQQFIRLVSSSNAIVQLHVHPFTVPGLERGPEAQAHIDAHYASFGDLQRDGLDALIVSGANVSNPDLADEPFWDPLAEVMDWAAENVTSTLCSCLSTHALIQQRYDIHRRRMLNKRWGVFPHRTVAPHHPLLMGTNTRFDVPHSRWNGISPTQLRAAGVQVLVETLDGDFHLGTSPDGIRCIYLQGHPEYDRVSLLKEYKREVARYLAGELPAAPPMPEGYFTDATARRASAYIEQSITDLEAGRQPAAFPEGDLAADIDITWTDTGRAIFNNWLGIVYRLTDMARGVPFMDGVDTDRPLDSLTR